MNDKNHEPDPNFDKFNPEGKDDPWTTGGRHSHEHGGHEHGGPAGPGGRGRGRGRGRRGGPGFGPGFGGPGFDTPGWGGWPGGPGPWGRGQGSPTPPPWLHEIVRHFGGPGLAAEFGGQFGGRRRTKARRGDVRSAILDVLAGDEMNGYQLIQQIQERTGGAWKPSPGSVYPTVQQLEDEGLVEGREVDGRRLLRLTDAGRSYVEDNAEEMAATWQTFEDDSEPERPAGDTNLMPVMSQVMGGMWQIMTTGTSQQRAEAAEILSETRRKLYGLLAEGDPE